MHVNLNYFLCPCQEENWVRFLYFFKKSRENDGQKFLLGSALDTLQPSNASSQLGGLKSAFGEVTDKSIVAFLAHGVYRSWHRTKLIWLVQFGSRAAMLTARCSTTFWHCILFASSDAVFLPETDRLMHSSWSRCQKCQVAVVRWTSARSRSLYRYERRTVRRWHLLNIYLLI